ncbi:hypothetical protein HER32_11990 [Hymenobacter sp. BT18]|uniref:hypothetical protein n=1 Tax=Hymenobacter sp. BT18 TaxID=2835648 RepID=UPI00143E9934|nr:hypothetical protein [Hymenobacter sp. BT18]QIX61863.1 hypothetical protein HER32_11990 [Hymenobacter sp. BT18]
MTQPTNQADTPRKPRSAPRVRGFLNLAPDAPVSDIVPHKDGAVITGGVWGGRGIAFGQGNTAPQVALEAALNSGTAYRCLEKRSAFLEGMGLPQVLADEEVPGQPGKTLGELWAEECSDGSYFNGAAFLVRYNLEKQIGEIHLLPFPSVRKTDKGTFLLNHKFGRKGFKAADTTEHQAFDNRPETIEAILKTAEEPIDDKKPGGPKKGQPGQILYVYISKAGEKDYPLPPHWAGLEDVLADASYARYELDEVDGGFNAKGMLAMIGEESTTADGEGKTEEDRTDDELKLFTGNGAKQAGVKRKSIMVLDVKTKETVPVWIPMNTTVDLKWLSEKKEAIGQTVCRHIGIPPILAGFAKAGQLGAAQEILNAVELTQDDLMPLRRKLFRGFCQLFPQAKNATIGNKRPISFVPPELMAVLTEEEKRKLAVEYGILASAAPAQPAAQPNTQP